MNHDYKATEKQQRRAKAPPFQPVAPVVVTPAPIRRRLQHLTVIQGEQRRNTTKVVREETLYMRRTETTEEGDE